MEEGGALFCKRSFPTSDMQKGHRSLRPFSEVSYQFIRVSSRDLSLIWILISQKKLTLGKKNYLWDVLTRELNGLPGNTAVLFFFFFGFREFFLFLIKLYVTVVFLYLASILLQKGWRYLHGSRAEEVGGTSSVPLSLL